MTESKRGKNINKIMICMIVFGFVLIAAAFIRGANLTEYEGTLEENLSYDLPAGFELQKASAEDPDVREYVREGENTIETLSVYYDGLEHSENTIIDETVQLDEDTQIGIGRLDWDHSYDNTLEFTVYHGDKETYYVEYQCQETDKDKYYSSCSKAQEDEMMSFIKTFDFHRPDGSDMNALQRLHSNLGTGGLIVLALAVLFFIGFPVAIGIGGLLGGKSGGEEESVSSKDLHAAMNREREAKGEESLPAINTVQGASTSNLARRDHSWSSVPDFFIKLFRGKK